MRPSTLALRWRILVLASAAHRRRNLLRQRRKSRALIRRNVSAINDMPDREFVKCFRLGKAQVRDLTEELAPFLKVRKRRDGISRDLKVLIALAFYATGSYQAIVGQGLFTNVSQTSVSRAVREVTDALNKIYHIHIKWPMQADERNAIKAKFYNRFHIPGVVGCIDGTHVAILRPTTHEERYYNRKGYHSLNVMIICDSDLNIMCVDASTPGSAHDSMVWQSHPLSSHLTALSDAGEQVFLLGDSGYPLRPTMMTPILNTQVGSAEHFYYQRHVTARNVVERCIGLLKARFRCLLVARALHYDPVTAGKITNACCVLHNIANSIRVPITPLTPDEIEAENQRQSQVEEQLQSEVENVDMEVQRRVNPQLQRGRALQQALIQRLWRERNIIN